MKQLLFLLVPVLFCLACEEDSFVDRSELNNTLVGSSQTQPAKKPKIWVCHYDQDSLKWIVININENAWRGHEQHGDFILDDADGDGYPEASQCPAENRKKVDCDDTNAEVNPGADEICNNGIDDDCDGLVDDEDDDCI